MKVTIIHKEGCPLCDMAIQEFENDGHEVEKLHSLETLKDMRRKSNMMTDMLSSGGDKDAFPNVFVYDRFVFWKPKKGDCDGEVCR